MAAILVLSITFFISYVFVTTMVGSEYVLRYFEAQPQIIAFFNPDAEVDSVKRAEDTMRALPFVKDVTVISKEDALNIFLEDNQDDPLTLQLVTADILPASIEVSAVDIQSLPQIEQALLNVPDVSSVEYQRDIVEQLHNWTNSIRLVGGLFITLLVATSVLIIIVITGMKVSSKRTAIRVMQLIGASGWYIKAPFLFEGMYYGVIGAIIGWVATYILSLYATPWLIQFFGEIGIVPIPLIFMGALLAGGVTSGVLIGGIASFFSSQRLLKY